jgi:hypothetical protein
MDPMSEEDNLRDEWFRGVPHFSELPQPKSLNEFRKSVCCTIFSLTELILITVAYTGTLDSVPHFAESGELIL